MWVGGMRMSVTTTSGLCSSTSARQPGRSAAAPTSSRSGAESINRASPCRSSALSSARTTVIGTPDSVRILHGVTSGSLPFLHGDRSVVRVLLERRAAGSTPGERLDDHRVALVIGGGGMRGSYVAGMLHALERAGLCAAFDEVYGSSSGAISAAAFLTGEAAACAACYPEDLCTRTFIDMRRLRSGRPVVEPLAAPRRRSGRPQAAGLGGAGAHARARCTWWPPTRPTSPRTRSPAWRRWPTGGWCCRRARRSRCSPGRRWRGTGGAGWTGRWASRWPSSGPCGVGPRTCW